MTYSKRRTAYGMMYQEIGSGLLKLGSGNKLKAAARYGRNRRSTIGQRSPAGH